MKATIIVNGEKFGSYGKSPEETFSDLMYEAHEIERYAIREAYQAGAKEAPKTALVIAGKKNGTKYVAGTVKDLLIAKVFHYCDYPPETWAITLENGKGIFGKSFAEAYKIAFPV